jgi:C4-dicarboxylate-specific signal transduction histidine kinase
LPMNDLIARVSVLPPDTAIIYTGIWSGGTVADSTPEAALATIGAVTNRPIVVDTEVWFGFGAAGGFLVRPALEGELAARIAVRILNGESVANIPVAIGDVNRPVFDWRQLKRFGISESSLPAGSEIRFREPTVWEQYRSETLAIFAALLFQAALIGFLIHEHRRRHLAEVSARHAMAELTHMNRVATAGELSASIAHEINQPLTGIVTRASAARRWLARENPDIDKARAALDSIETAGYRASEIIKNLRAMFRKDTAEKSAVDINKLIWNVLGLTYIDLRKHGIDVESRLDDQIPPVLGNQVQLQQVILNLIMNAVDSMRSVQPRVLSITSRLNGPDRVQVSIEDTGIGISPANLGQVFKPLFTTKDDGMGIGLSICHSIVENHNGRIWVTAGSKSGTIFHFELPKAV